MMAWAKFWLAVLLWSGVHHFGQSCEEPHVERVVFSRTGQESVSLSLLANISSETSTVLWARGNNVVARIRHGNITVSGKRTSISINGTLQLQQVKKYDSGAYKMEGYDTAGKCMFRELIWLEVQDPVSRPIVSVVSCKCGRVDLRCEVERGDNVSYRWADLGGSVNASLGGSALLSLESGDRQELVCVASNGVSTEASDPLKPDCPAAITPHWDSSKVEATKGFKTYTELLCVFGVLVIILCSVLCITLWNRGRKRFYTGGGLSAEYSDVVYVPVQIVNSNKGAPGEGCGLA